MRNSSCQIESANESDTVRCGKPAVAECADCGASICSACRTECCGQSFCDHCYDYHASYSCLRKPSQVEGQTLPRRTGKDAAA